jgi:predicted metal-dependent phosphoesterase TrpH
MKCMAGKKGNRWKADLHIHSNFSNDGELEIARIVEMCREYGIRTFSVTDHNVVGGTREAARQIADYQEINFIPGIEMDCNYKGTDLHLLGYQIDLSGDTFDMVGKNEEQKHLDAVPQMINNLKRLGIEIDQERLMVLSEGSPPTGEQFGEFLLSDPVQRFNPLMKPYLQGGERSDMPLINFYLDYFAQGKPAYVKIEHMGFADAIELVRSRGGIPVIAHPGLNFKGREDRVAELMERGAAGLEVFNNYHSSRQTSYFAGLVKERGALMTCGSDFHGKTKPLISIGQFTALNQFGTYLESCLNTIQNHHVKKQIQ